MDEIEQVDREAADEVVCAMGYWDWSRVRKEAILSGRLDHEPLLKVLARHRRAALTPAPAVSNPNGEEMPEVAAIRYLNELREPTGSSVTILCDDEEAWTRDKQMAIEVCSDWTAWDTIRFYGESILQCAAKAICARNGIAPPPPEPRS